jgi:hypothetical protein
MERKGRVLRVWQTCLLAIAIMSATLAACGGSTPQTGTVTGTVHFISDVPPNVHSIYPKVVASLGNHQAGETPLTWGPLTEEDRVAGSSVSRTGSYRMSLAPGRYVFAVGGGPRPSFIYGIVVVRANATTTRDIFVVFHGSGLRPTGSTGVITPIS